MILLPEVRAPGDWARLAVFVGDLYADGRFLWRADGEVAVTEAVCSLANLGHQVSRDGRGRKWWLRHYRLHETTRAYALEKLAEGGEFEQVARRHANYYRDLFDSAETELQRLPAPAWLARYGRQIGQVRAGFGLGLLADWRRRDRRSADRGRCAAVGAFVADWRMSSVRVERGRFRVQPRAETHVAICLYAALGAVLF